jgi:hypothetical protein
VAVAAAVMLSRPGPSIAQSIGALDKSAGGATSTASEAHDASPNLVVPHVLRNAVDTMWRDSATFKAQCARLRAAPSLRVEVRVSNPSQRGPGKAWTTFVRGSQGRLRADIYLTPGLPLLEVIELIAHEVEHVIEQLDDVELIAAARHGIHGTVPGVFETARATHIGQKISREVYDAMNRR